MAEVKLPQGAELQKLAAAWSSNIAIALYDGCFQHELAESLVRYTEVIQRQTTEPCS